MIKKNNKFKKILHISVQNLLRLSIKMSWIILPNDVASSYYWPGMVLFFDILSLGTFSEKRKLKLIGDAEFESE